MAALESGPSIQYMAVARLSDGVVVGSHTFDKSTGYDFGARFGAIAGAQGLPDKIGNHGTVADGGHHMHLGFLQRPHFLLVVATTLAFPAARRVMPSTADPGAPRMLPEMADAVQAVGGSKLGTASPGSLSRALAPAFKRLAAKYSDAGACGDKLGAAQDKVDGVRSTMVANMEKVLARGDRMDTLVDKSETLNASAGQFQQGSTALRRAMQCRYYKVTALLALVALAVLAYILYPIISAAAAE